MMLRVIVICTINILLSCLEPSKSELGSWIVYKDEFEV